MLAIHPVWKPLEYPYPRRSSGASPGAVYTDTLELHHNVDVLLVLAEARVTAPPSSPSRAFFESAISGMPKVKLPPVAAVFVKTATGVFVVFRIGP
jgi:hypothetical protein